MYEPPVYNDKIWIVFGPEPDKMWREEYKGMRSMRALKPYVQRKARGGSQKSGTPIVNYVYLQYESPNFSLSDITLGELHDMGIIRENINKKTYKLTGNGKRIIAS